ncbi:hypothetical protein [Acetivibrio cellulolyticus]|uniref:hypothetical protein n=1 Tax=Acetivibrio cellulolyticus TaxID=35830 RepID=UPI0001E2C6E3|nr:hypothetical protein [Acetivibrio cellulolyticus]
MLLWKQGDYFYVPDNEVNIFGWKRQPYGPVKYILEKVFTITRFMTIIDLTTHSEK